MFSPPLLRSIFSLLRPGNLFFLLAYSLLLFSQIILPPIFQCNIQPGTSFFFQICISIVGCLLLAGANVINDIFDIYIDQQEKLDRPLANGSISIYQAKIIYFILVLSGAVFAIYICAVLQLWEWLVLYPLAVGIFYLYSRYFKCIPLLGNVLVSFSIAALPFILSISEMNALKILREKCTQPYNTLIAILFILALNAFLINLCREILKDMEDKNADALGGCKSTAVVFSDSFLRIIIYTILFIVLIIQVIFFSLHFVPISTILFSIFLICWGLVFYQFKNAKAAFQYHQPVTTLKWLMLAGMCMYLFPF